MRPKKQAPESQTLIVLSEDPVTIDDPSGEKAAEVISWLCAFCFSLLSSSVAAREGRWCQFWAKGRRIWRQNAPESQTLIVPILQDTPAPDGFSLSFLPVRVFIQ